MVPDIGGGVDDLMPGTTGAWPAVLCVGDVASFILRTRLSQGADSLRQPPGTSCALLACGNVIGGGMAGGMVLVERGSAEPKLQLRTRKVKKRELGRGSPDFAPLVKTQQSTPRPQSPRRSFSFSLPLASLP